MSIGPRTPIVDPDVLRGFCLRWSISELALFGSQARGDANDQSDLDLMVSFEPEARWGLLDLAAMERELSEIFGRQVDLNTRRSIERSENPVFRDSALAHVRAVYSTGS